MEEMKVTIDISLRERSTNTRLRAGMRKLKWKDHPELQRGTCLKNKTTCQRDGSAIRVLALLFKFDAQHPHQTDSNLL